MELVRQRLIFPICRCRPAKLRPPALGRRRRGKFGVLVGEMCDQPDLKARITECDIDAVRVRLCDSGIKVGVFVDVNDNPHLVECIGAVSRLSGGLPLAGANSDGLVDHSFGALADRFDRDRDASKVSADVIEVAALGDLAFCDYEEPSVLLPRLAPAWRIRAPTAARCHSETPTADGREETRGKAPYRPVR